MKVNLTKVLQNRSAIIIGSRIYIILTLGRFFFFIFILLFSLRADPGKDFFSLSSYGKKLFKNCCKNTKKRSSLSHREHTDLHGNKKMLILSYNSELEMYLKGH